MPWRGRRVKRRRRGLNRALIWGFLAQEADMPRYFFDLASPAGLEPDDMGIEFPDLDAAYLEAVHAIGEITLELLRKREDPGRYRFEVRDETRRLVMELSFAEVLRPRLVVAPAAATDTHEQLRQSLERSRALKAELAEGLVKARAAIETARATLARSRAR